jgi:hypothetical protein
MHQGTRNTTNDLLKKLQKKTIGKKLAVREREIHEKSASEASERTALIARGASRESEANKMH